MLLCIEQALSALGSRAVQQQELQALLALLVRHCDRDGDFLLHLCITRDVNSSRVRHLAEIVKVFPEEVWTRGGCRSHPTITRPRWPDRQTIYKHLALLHTSRRVIVRVIVAIYKEKTFSL